MGNVMFDRGAGGGRRLGMIVLSTDETLEYEARQVFEGRGVNLMHNRIESDPAVTPDSLKAMAALQGKSIKDFVLANTIGDDDEAAALEEDPLAVLGPQRDGLLGALDRHLRDVVDALEQVREERAVLRAGVRRRLPGDHHLDRGHGQRSGAHEDQ